MQEFGHAPSYFHFHVLTKGTTDVQVLEVPYDTGAINRYLEHVLRPTIEDIEAGVYLPNTNGWHCSSRYCAWYETVCPLGAAAHGSGAKEAAA